VTEEAVRVDHRRRPSSMGFGTITRRNMRETKYTKILTYVNH
jgi:hypothetical protein